jgi:hypothetical protein
MENPNGQRCLIRIPKRYSPTRDNDLGRSGKHNGDPGHERFGQIDAHKVP